MYIHTHAPTHTPTHTYACTHTEDVDNIAPHREYAITIEEDEEENCTQLFKKS